MHCLWGICIAHPDFRKLYYLWPWHSCCGWHCCCSRLCAKSTCSSHLILEIYTLLMYYINRHMVCTFYWVCTWFRIVKYFGVLSSYVFLMGYEIDIIWFGPFKMLTFKVNLCLLIFLAMIFYTGFHSFVDFVLALF